MASRQHPAVWLLIAFAVLVVVAFINSKVDQRPTAKLAEQIRADRAAEATMAAKEAVADMNAVKLSASAIKDCEAKLHEIEKIGLVRDRPQPNRIDVDERLWAEMPYKQKELLLGLVSCAAFGHYIPLGDDYAAAYGWRDGERKLVLGSTGSF